MPGFNISSRGGKPSAKIESVRKHRWLFEALDPVKDILIYAYKADRPSPEIDRIVVHQAQDEAYLPGKNRWKPIDISFYEVVTGGPTALPRQLSNRSLYLQNVWRRGQNFAKMADKPAELIYGWWSEKIVDLARSRITQDPIKKECELSLLNGVGDPIYTYYMYGCWISNVTPSALDYTDTAIAEITFTLQMDKVKESSR